MLQPLISGIQNSIFCPFKFVKKQRFAPKLIEKSINSILSKKVKLKCKEKHLLLKVKIITL